MKNLSLKIEENYPLQSLHTFGIDVKTKYFLSLNSLDDIDVFGSQFDQVPKPIYFLGGGANSLFINDYKGTVVHIFNKGIALIEETETEVLLKVQAGEDWDELVQFCVENEYYGLENLSAIPGQVGTAPIQNIGAYGVEAKDCIEEVYYFDLDDKETYVLDNSECEFGYRDSIFKHELKEDIIITEVVFRLMKNGKLNLDYGAIKEELKKQAIIQANITQLSDTIRSIRTSKLPDPKIEGNGGSFFKNPVVDLEKYKSLKKQFPEIVAYQNGDKMKIAAGWMIDFLGWKGKKHNGAAVHTLQALVLINKNNTTGQAVKELSEMIQQDVQKHFGIKLEAEVEFVF